MNGERKEVFVLRIVRGRSRRSSRGSGESHVNVRSGARTRRGSGESHLVNGERKVVFEDCEREKYKIQQRIW